MAGGEAEDGGGDRKRRMKSKEQLDALEKAYAEDRYPMEAMRAELSAALNLTDKQLQMWFCHRRLKDRKGKEDDNPSAPKKAKKEKAPAAQPVLEEPPALALAPPQPPEAAATVAALAAAAGALGAPAVAADEAKQQPKHKQQQQQEGMEGFEWEEAVPAVPKPRRKNPEASPAARRRPTAKNKRAAAEEAAIAAVEQQLGEPVREDGPPLGVEFDPIPAAGFGAPTIERDLSVPPGEVAEDVSKVPVRRGLNARKVKAAARNRPPLPTSTVAKRKATLKSASTSNAQPQQRPVREYQFIPEQPTGRPEEPHFYDRTAQLNLYPNAERPYDVVAASRVRSLTQPGPLFTANEPYAPGDVYFQARVPGVGPSMFPPPEAGASGLIPPNDLNFEGGQRLEGFTSFGIDGHHPHAPHALLQALAATKAFEPENLNLFQEQERARNEKKRKMEQKEREAQEKKAKKELDKLKKKEEQLKKEQVNKLKKEQEKFQREQDRLKREEERKEKKMEKLRQREELRQKKEAAKVKAANERATAKKLAKESSDLMDDERLELMEVAVSVQGLSSITQLPADTLESLDSFKAMLKPFPPHSLRMKRPFSVRPWTDHKENVGNAFMVWRFLTSFADVLGLWPFTFDELIQAFHDYDPRLLGEVHVALLKTLVKDVEEAAQAAATGVAGSQNALSIIAGGHPEIVEAAYAWGFDIREWKTHVSPLTWPEVLRQFALAANFGPKWKKRKVEPAPRPKEEAKVVEAEDVVSTLRSGAAAANAVALMQGKGVGHVRRNQYRMTPGTVKFAAFHILSLEGDKGLSILQVADRIQKSGLRDLSSSRTPEASIAAALSRDANLFERVAPSTYCVRPAFRKDPVDAEEVLDAAREKISLFQSGMLEGEEADKEVEDVDEEGDRDDDYDMEEQYMDDNKSEYAEAAQPPGKASFLGKPEKALITGDDDKKKAKVVVTGLSANSHSSNSGDSISGDTDNGEKDFQSPEHGTLERLENPKQEGEFKDEGVQPETNKAGLVYEETEIDESQVGEPWVQGLTEGEYADLSVEERLIALVALVNVVNEGTTIRVALEERLEAAAALKRQMWAEAQLDRRRQKEEQLSRLQVAGKTEGVSPNGVADGRQSPVLGTDCKQVDVSLPSALGVEAGGADSFGAHIAVASTSMASQRPSAIQDMISGQDVSFSAFAHSSEKSRAQLKADIGVRAEELYVLRSLPLGFDRRRNRFWQFVTSMGGDDPGCGRIYFESHDESHWEVIDTEEGLDALIASLDPRGIRENNLLVNLQRLECTLRLAMRNCKNGSEMKLLEDRVVKVEPTTNWRREPDSSARQVTGGVEGSPASGLSGQEAEYLDRAAAITIDLGKTEVERNRALERYRELDRWMWNEQTQEASSLRAFKIRKKRDQDLLYSCNTCHDFYWPRDKHCHCCHGTFDSSSKVHPKFSEHTRECEEQMRSGDPSWKQLGPSAPQPSRFQLLKAKTLAIEVTIPSAAVKVPWKDQQRKAWVANLKDASSPGEMLQVVTELESIVHRDWLSSSYETTEEMLKNVVSDTSSYQPTESHDCTRVLPWIPQTTAAVALRIAVLDAAIAYTHEEKLVREKQKEEEAKNIKAGISAVKISPDLLTAQQNGANGGEDCLGDGTGDGKARGARKKRGEGPPRSRSKARTSGGGAGGMGGGAREGGASGNGKAAGGAKSTAGTGRSAGGTGKRGLKRKLQFSEDGTAIAGTTTETQAQASKERKRPRSGTGKAGGGRPRGRPPGRPRNKASAGAAAGGARGGRRGKAVPGGKKKERDPNELMASADGKQQKLSQGRAQRDEDESDEEEDGYQHVDEQGDWGVPEESDEGEQYDEEQPEEDDNGEDMAEEEEEEEMDEDGSGGSGRAHHLVGQEDDDDVAEEDDARYEEEDGYRDHGEESEAEEEAEDEERVEEEVDASEDEAGEQLQSYSSDSE